MRTGRPRKAVSDDPRVEARRATYRRSRARRYERIRHRRDECLEARGQVCPLTVPKMSPGPARGSHQTFR